MKKAILFCIAVSVLLFSCKKDQSKIAKIAQKTYKVNFNVSGFAQTVINTTNGKLQLNALRTDATIAITNYLDVLYYYVFETNDANRNLVHSLVQDSTMSNFGTIADNLPAGTYIVVIAAGKKGLVPIDELGGYHALGTLAVTYNAPWQDTFFDEFQLTVSDGDVHQNVTLSRIVGQLEVNVEDAIPAAAKSISITTSSKGSQFGFLNQQMAITSIPVTFTTTLPDSVKGKTNFKIDHILGNIGAPFNVNIVCYDASQNVLGTAIVDSVICQANKRTILSGKLIGSNNTFNVNLNGAWNATPITIPF